MKVAMAAPDQSLFAAFDQERPQPVQCRKRLPFEIDHRALSKQIRVLHEDGRIIADELFERRESRGRFNRVCTPVHRCDGNGELSDEPVVEFATLR